MLHATQVHENNKNQKWRENWSGLERENKTSNGSIVAVALKNLSKNDPSTERQNNFN